MQWGLLIRIKFFVIYFGLEFQNIIERDGSFRKSFNTVKSISFPNTWVLTSWKRPVARPCDAFEGANFSYLGLPLNGQLDERLQVFPVNKYISRKLYQQMKNLNFS